MPAGLAELGIDREEFDAALPALADAAFADPSLRTNPRMPLIAELVALLEAGYGGRG
jgi:acetaldehyde dehydrogenase/alcohol dehydrogenase